MKDSNTTDNAIAVIPEATKVKGFNPLRFLRKTTKGPKLDLGVKKLWFNMKYPNGRIKVSPVKITDQLAIMEAKVFFDSDDVTPAVNIRVKQEKQKVANGLYVEAAQHSAVDKALSEAGFDVKLVSANETPQKKATTPTTKKAVAEPIVVTTAEPDTAVSEPVKETPKTEHTKVVQQTITDTDTARVVLPYNKDMSVAEICKVMTPDEAKSLVVNFGACSGWTLETVAERRPSSLKLYVANPTMGDNIIKAGATLMLKMLENKAA